LNFDLLKVLVEVQAPTIGYRHPEPNVGPVQVDAAGYLGPFVTSISVVGGAQLMVSAANLHLDPECTVRVGLHRTAEEGPAGGHRIEAQVDRLAGEGEAQIVSQRAQQHQAIRHSLGTQLDAGFGPDEDRWLCRYWGGTADCDDGGEPRPQVSHRPTLRAPID